MTHGHKPEPLDLQPVKGDFGQVVRREIKRPGIYEIQFISQAGAGSVQLTQGLDALADAICITDAKDVRRVTLTQGTLAVNFTVMGGTLYLRWVDYA